MQLLVVILLTTSVHSLNSSEYEKYHQVEQTCLLQVNRSIHSRQKGHIAPSAPPSSVPPSSLDNLQPGAFILLGIVMFTSISLFLCYHPSWLSADNHCTGGHSMAPAPTITNSEKAASPSSLWFLDGLLKSIAYSAAIPGSYAMAKHLETGPVFSGLIVSMFPLLCSVPPLVFAFVPRRPIMNHRVLWTASTFCTGFACLIGWMCCLPGLRPVQASCLLLMSRSIMGFAQGVSAWFRIDAQIRMLSSEEMAKAVQVSSIGMGLGLAVGPMTSSWGMYMMQNWHSDGFFILMTSAFIGVMALLIPLCFIIWNNVPKDLNTASPPRSCEQRQISGNANSTDVRSAQVSTLWKDARLRAMLGGLSVGALLHSIMQFVEVGSALILELLFQWQPRDIGTAIGISLLASVLVAGISGFWIQSQPSLQRQFRRAQFGLVVAILSSSLFMPFRIDGFPPWLPILIADALVVGFLIASGSPMQAAMQSLTDADGGQWSSQNLQILYTAWDLGRGIAGPLARWLISFSSTPIVSQTTYAIAQMLFSFTLLVISLVIFEPAVRTCLDLLARSDDFQESKDTASLTQTVTMRSVLLKSPKGLKKV